MRRFISYIGIVIIAISAVTVEAKPKKGKGKPTKERFEKAKKERDKDRDDAKKKGHKHRKGGFHRIIRDDKKLQEIKEKFEEAAKKLKGFKHTRNNPCIDKNAIREKMRGRRSEWVKLMKERNEEVSKRMKEIRKEMANKRDKQIDSNKPKP